MDFTKSSFTILGAGRSGIAAAKLLKRNGAKVFLSDASERTSLRFLDEDILKREGIEYELGGHSERIYKNEFFIKSPGIPPDSEILIKAERLNKKIYSEIEAASWFCSNPVIAITGTNGKTTTTVLTGEIFMNAGYDVKVCGNVGVPFSSVIDELRHESVVILEVSSYQLNNIEKFKPKISVLMNITPDHLDWHKTFQKYLDAKLKIYKNLTEEEQVVVNYDDEVLRESIKNIKPVTAYFSIRENLAEKEIRSGSFINNGKIIYFDKARNINEEIMETREINIRGNHNLYNSLAAIISARSFGIKKELIRDTLMKFHGVEHRIEFVREINGVSFYNDSKATNIDSLIVALEAFEGNLILLLGGRESGNDYSKIDKLIKEKVKKIIAIGETREKIFQHFRTYIDVFKAENFEAAVKKSFELSERGDTILLSPACKSFDMFDSFEHRGKEFKNIVNQMGKTDAEK